MVSRAIWVFMGGKSSFFMFFYLSFCCIGCLWYELGGLDTSLHVVISLGDEIIPQKLQMYL